MRDKIQELESQGKWKVIWLDTVDSTNTFAKQAALDGAVDHTLVIADFQTAGRGRRGRVFVSAKGQGIFMTLLLRPDFKPTQASMITLVAGLAVRKAIFELTGLETQIKWPNDLVLNEKKLCGILTEMSAKPEYIEYLVVGIGVNVNQEIFPKELGQLATSVFIESGKQFERMDLLESILQWFEHYYERFLKTCDLSELKEEYNAHMINLGKDIIIEQGKEKFSALARGIDSDGELVIERAGALEKVLSGEVSVRGVYGYV